MFMRLRPLAAFALTLLVGTSCARSSEVSDLQRQVVDLQEDLANLRASIGRPRPVIDLARGHLRGNPEAVVALIEYSDYQCPFCLRHSRETMPLIEQQYIATGKVLYGFRDFPIEQLHPEAIVAHEAAQCAGDQRKFWEMHARMFGPPSQHTPEAIDALAQEVGLDVAALRACMQAGTHRAAILDSVAQVSSFGASGTPAFFIGHVDKAANTLRITRAISGALPFEQFAQALDTALAQPPPGR